jgi:hypothetical protein
MEEEKVDDCRRLREKFGCLGCNVFNKPFDWLEILLVALCWDNAKDMRLDGFVKTTVEVITLNVRQWLFQKSYVISSLVRDGTDDE